MLVSQSQTHSLGWHVKGFTLRPEEVIGSKEAYDSSRAHRCSFWSTDIESEYLVTADRITNSKWYRPENGFMVEVGLALCVTDSGTQSKGITSQYIPIYLLSSIVPSLLVPGLPPEGPGLHPNLSAATHTHTQDVIEKWTISHQSQQKSQNWVSITCFGSPIPLNSNLFSHREKSSDWQVWAWNGMGGK